MSRQALGRGLGALIPNKPAQSDAGSAEGDRVVEVPVEEIYASRFQPRTVFNEESLKELAASIKEQGVIQPIILSRKSNGYELIAGERRWRAVKSLGYKKIPAIVKTVRDSDALEMAIIENIQRENLNPVEEALAYERLLNEFAFTQESLAQKVGKSRSAIANFLRLLRLPDDIRDDLSDGRLTMGHARALLAVDDPAAQKAMRDQIVNSGMNVRQTEDHVRTKTKKPKRSTPKGSGDIHLDQVGIRIERRLGAQVRIKGGAKGGTITIRYADDDELDRIIDLMGA